MTDAAEIKRLRKLLAPFAAEADQWLESVSDRYHPGMTEPRSRTAHAKAVFNLGDLRRARAALAEVSGKPPDNGVG